MSIGNRIFYEFCVRQVIFNLMKYDYDKITKEMVEESVKQSSSYLMVIKKLNLPSHGSTYPKIKSLIKGYNIDTSHFSGSAWNKGKTVINDCRVCKQTVNEIFSKNSKASSTHIRRLIVKHSLMPYECLACKNAGEWMKQKLKLQLDHKNGDRHDNRLKNLRWLCPNCHSQTETFCVKNVTKGKISDEKIIKALRKYNKVSDALKSLNIYSGRNYYRAYKLSSNI